MTTQVLAPYQKWLKFLAIILLTMAIVLRFTNLDSKFYWHDEVINSFGVSGYTVEQAKQELSQQLELNFGLLKKYQYPNADKSFLAPAIVLAQEEPQNPPLYYLISWLWLRIFGNSIVATRSISVIISLLLFPCVYWLSIELFNSKIIAWIATILVAVSPFYLLYAQEARPYSLWSVTVLLSSIFLLKAKKNNQNLDWIIYSVTLILSFYTFPFSLFVAISHGIYFGFTNKFKVDKKFLKYIVASLSSIVAYAPWLLFIQLNSHKISDWRAVDISLFSLVKSWIGNISRIFFDLNLDSTAPLIYIIPPTIIFLFIVLYSIYYLCTKTSPEIWLFIITLIAITGLALALPDLISGGQRSRIPRYLTPCYLGINLAIAYYIGTNLIAHQFRKKIISITLLILLVVSGILSCFFYSQANNWWHKSWEKLSSYDDLTQISIIVNQSTSALVIAPEISKINEDVFFELLSLTHLIKSEVKLQFGLNKETNLASDFYETIFIYHPLHSIPELNLINQLQPITDSFAQIIN